MPAESVGNGDSDLNRGDPSRRKGLRVGRLIAILAVVGAFAFVVWAFGAAWRLGGDVRMSAHGYVAMALAAGLTGLLGAGLMWLAFYSARKGYDDRQDPLGAGDRLTSRDHPPEDRVPHR